MENSLDRIDCKIPSSSEAARDAFSEFRDNLYANKIVQRNSQEDPASKKLVDAAERFAKEELVRFPKAIQKLLSDNKVEVVASSSIAAAAKGDPTLRQFEPEASTHNNFYYHDKGKTRIFVNPNGDLPHEGGHAVNWHAGSMERNSPQQAPARISDSDDFIRAYREDVSRIPESDRKKLGYFLQQPEKRGRDETFAELFMYLTLPPSDMVYPNDLRKPFPRTTEYIKEKLDKLNLLCD